MKPTSGGRQRGQDKKKKCYISRESYLHAKRMSDKENVKHKNRIVNEMSCPELVVSAQFKCEKD